MEAQKFLELIEKIRSNTYVESELNLAISEFDEEHFVDRIDDEQAVMLAEALKQNIHISKVNLHGNDIRDVGAVAMASVLTLEELNLDRNRVEFKGLAALAKSNLKTLVISPSITEEDLLGGVEMINAFATNKTLESLDLVGSCFPNRFLNHFLSELIVRNTAIKTLTLPRYEKIEDADLKFIGDNKTLKDLHIGRSNLTDVGAWYIGGNTGIETLKINQSNITDIGAVFLTLPSTLKKLEICDSNITAKGAKVFIYSNLKEFIIGGKYNVLSYEDSNNINLTFRDARDENCEVQFTKKAKVTYQDIHTNYNTEAEGPWLLGEAEENFALDNFRENKEDQIYE